MGSSGPTSSPVPKTWAESMERRLVSEAGRSGALKVGGLENASITRLEGDSSFSVRVLALSYELRMNEFTLRAHVND